MTRRRAWRRLSLALYRLGDALGWLADRAHDAGDRCRAQADRLRRDD